MALYRSRPPQLAGGLFLADGGLETDLMFNRGFDLPFFSSLVLTQSVAGLDALRRYYREHAALAQIAGYGFITETATWRASPDWGAALGMDASQLIRANKIAVEVLEDVRLAAGLSEPFVISACVGPRGDGYDPGALMTAEEAADYHGFQMTIFAETAADIATGVTMTNTPEAIGVARAGAYAGLPVVISFTVETDGRLPTGQPLADAIAETDASVFTAPLYYMINCAHPSHFANVLRDGGAWLSRLRGIRVNASRCSHAELDEAETLDIGDPAQLGQECADLRALAPALTVFGGCCGTDIRHLKEMAAALTVGGIEPALASTG